MNVHALPSLASLNARSSMDLLVDRARSLRVFGPTVDFNSPVWDLASVKPGRPTAGSAKAPKLYFTEASNTAKTLAERTLLAPEFSALIKSLIVVREHARPRGR